MKSKLLIGLVALSLPVFSAASTITFDNQTSQNPSTIRLYVGTGGAGACSTSPMVRKMTGNEGMTHPKQRNDAALSPQVEAVLCKGQVCKADLYMNANCSGSPLAVVTLPLGQTATVSPEVSADGKYRFIGITNGVLLTCADGTDNC